MYFRKSSSSKPSPSRGCNKVRLTNKHNIAEIWLMGRFCFKKWER